jgi:hypothetical protein
MVYFGSVFLKIVIMAPIFGLLFQRSKIVFTFVKKMGWDTFWVIFFTNQSGNSGRGSTFFNPTVSCKDVEQGIFIPLQGTSKLFVYQMRGWILSRHMKHARSDHGCQMIYFH